MVVRARFLVCAALVTASLVVAGGGPGAATPHRVAADKVDWTGNSTFGVNCAAYGMGAIPAIYTVRLSE